MPNYLKMELINAILALRKRGWSKRRVARELNVDRPTVRRYLREESKSPAISTAGNTQPETETHPVSTAGPGAAESGVSGGGAVQKSSGRRANATLTPKPFVSSWSRA